MNLILRVNGIVLVILSLAMLPPMIVDLSTYNSDWMSFGLCSFLSSFLGVAFITVTDGDFSSFNRKQAFIITVNLWIMLGVFAALPFFFTDSDYSLSFTDSFFEAVSGLTTTGSTVMTDLDHAPRGLLLWRSIIEWIGGIGIVVMTMAIFPALKIGGMQLFRSESSDNSDKMLPTVHQTAIATGGTYLVLTVSCTIAYYAAGMETFDAINHALTTMSTGGFSTHDSSIAYFHSPAIEIVASIFMFLGGIPLLLYFSLATGRKADALLLSQSKAYIWLLGFAITILSLWLITKQHFAIIEAVRHSTFTLISIVTTTGFASTDYTLWGYFAVILIYFLTIAGGCTGSTSGGMKIFRLQVLSAAIQRESKQLTSPNGIFPIKVGKIPIPESAERSVKIFIILFAFVFMVVTTLLAASGLDFITSLSAAATSISNVGPGLGDIIGPTGTFKTLPDFDKWVLAFAMITGRLELLTVFVFLMPQFWRD